MSKQPFCRLLSFGFVLTTFLAACASPAATSIPTVIARTEAPPEPTQPPQPTPTPLPTATPEPQIGSERQPIKLVFAPSGDIERIVGGGQYLAEALRQATGLTFEIVVPTTYAAAVEEMCASPDDTMGFLPTLGYALAAQLCGVKIAAKGERFGSDWHAAMIVVARNSEAQTITDLNGKKWAYPEATSIGEYFYPLVLFKEAGVAVGESVASGSPNAAIKAVYRGEADFATAPFSPPLVDGKPIDWQPPQSADVPADLLDSCAPTPEQNALMCGNIEIRDARHLLRQELPDVIQKVRILTTTPKLPTDPVFFGPNFPPELLQQLLQALFTFAQNDPEGFAKAFEAYSWTGIHPATDTEYAPILSAIQASGFRIEDLDQ